MRYGAGGFFAFSLDRFAALKQKKANMAKRTCPNIVPRIQAVVARNGKCVGFKAPMAKKSPNNMKRI